VRFPVLVAVAVTVALVGAPSVAAPVPKDAGRKPVYFPTAVGAKWVYETADGLLETAVVSAVEKTDGGLIVSRAGADGTRTVYTKMVVSADGLRQARDGADDLGWVLKTNVKAGDSWDMPEGGTRTVYGPEEVKVPAGTFTALRVVWEQNGATYTSWYAGGIGEVKRARTLDGTVTVTRALKSFQLKGGK